jgi:hypothetical protein
MSRSSNAKQLAVVQKRLVKFIDRDVPAARQMATNAALAEIKTIVVKRVSADVGAKQKIIRPRVHVDRARGGKKPRAARLHFYNRGIPLILLNPKEVGGGISASGFLVPEGFIADGSKGFGQYQKGGGYASTRLKKKHVLHRTGRDRYPLKVSVVNIKGIVGKAVPEIVASNMPAIFLKKYNAAIKRKASFK